MEGRTDHGAGRKRNAAGGGEGGEHAPDEGWRKELAAAWSQSNTERGALRAQYAAVRDTIREAKGDPDLGVFDHAMTKIEKLHEQVQRPMEQLADGEVLLDLANALVSATKSENREGPTPSQFVTSLLRKFGVRASPLVDSYELFSWPSLSTEASPLFMAATGCQTMHGPMDLAIKERRRRAVRKQYIRLDTSRPEEIDELAPEPAERNDTDKNMSVMFGLLRRNRSVKLENIILNRQSFAQTVENIFSLSFLLKDGRVAINIDDNRDHIVIPKNAPAAGLIASKKVFNSQFVFRFDFKDWKLTLCNALPLRICRPKEQVVDGEALLDLTNVLVEAAKSENRDGPGPSEFVTALLREFGARVSPLSDSNELFSWSDLGAAVLPLFMTATGSQTMIGPMGASVKERRHAARRQSERLGRKEVDELVSDQDERNDTDGNIAVMFGLLRKNGRVKLENLVLNRQSFAQTVENVFALSFLVKDGRAEISVDDSGNHLVMPRNAPAAGQITSGEVVCSQFVFRFDFRDWQLMKGVVEPGTELMPHRNSQVGGQHENRTPCPVRGRSQLGSDSEQQEDEDFRREGAMKSTKENAVEGNLPNSFSGLKKRKRTNVARRLFPDRD
ncbi:hypothetical protein PR202_ga21448 [Eleusine coracana subsp. coracana]|uniref:Non-structural maintenance of chromosomes element 4 n=1 Tax=Eleusine coracana subsp. coracana TaxID=191504 RepID=A0AAV5CZN7_ELECO|nr:hypothetical protein PR202_ga21448 [Eleusine coracana subsp. coracana]